MSNVHHSIEKCSNPDYRVGISINKADDNRYLLYGKLLTKDGTAVKDVSPTRRFAKSFEDAKRQISALVYAVSCKIPGAKTDGERQPKARQSENDMDKVVKDLLDKKTVFFDKTRAGSVKKAWNENTHRMVYTYWLNHGISDLLMTMANSGNPNAILKTKRAELIAATKDHGRSGGTEQRAAQTVDTNLYRMNVLLIFLRESHPEFPDVDLTGASLGGRAIPAEQIKALPEQMCQYIRGELEARYTDEPREVLCTVLMFDCALRTAEAAGIKPNCIFIYDTYAVIAVMSQEENGARSERLKTDNAYRYVVSSFWGMTMIQNCLDAMKLDPDDDTLLLTAPELSSWIRELLKSYDKKFVDEAERTEQSNPDYDDKGLPIYDISAYVLRRNAASRWLNYDGLTHDEIDMMIGHKEKEKRPEVYLMDEAHQKEIAVKLERYVYNPQWSKNPLFSPVEVVAGSHVDLEAYPAQRIVNVGDTPLRVHLDLAACCPNEVIEIRVPSGTAEMPICRSEKLKPASRIVINSNLSTFEKNTP